MKNYIFGLAIFSDGSTKTSRNFTSPNAFSNWVNRQFITDHGVTVYEYEMTPKTYDIREVGIWHE